MENFLEVRNAAKTYSLKNRVLLTAVSDVSFSLKKGRCLGIVGESGSGKSTLCRLITGIEGLSSGRILFRGEEVQVRKFHREMQMVFQNSRDAVNHHLKVYHTVEEPLENFFRMEKKQRRRQVEKLLEMTGLSSEDMDKYPGQLSGGQLQRVCIARALAAGPECILLDEPLSSLDVSVQAQLLNLLADLKDQMSLTYILVSHDLKAVYYLADELIVMYRGCVVEQIEGMELFKELCHPYSLRLLSAHDRVLAQRDEYADASDSFLQKDSGGAGCPYASECTKAAGKCRRERPQLKEIKKGHRLACMMLIPDG